MEQAIYAKLLKVQSQLKAPKSQYNKFGGYNYRNCEDILESVKPLLTEQSLLLTLTDELQLIGDRHYIKAIATVVDVHTGDKIQVHAFAREEESKKGMDASQITGASSSYARKYALNGLFNIDDSKDSDTTNTHEKQQTEQKYYCKICKQQIKEESGKQGKKVSAKEVYEKLDHMCITCWRKQKEKEHAK